MTPRDDQSKTLSQWAVLHAGLMILFLSWRFGGMEPTTRMIAGWACLPSPLITAYALWKLPRECRQSAWWILGPLALLGAEVFVSIFNPNRQFVLFWETPVLRAINHVNWAPTTPFPSATVSDFTFNAGLWLCGINLMLTRPPRNWLRGLLWAITLNGTILAGVGILFKLTKAAAILGVTPSPNPSFFATFIYHNHWGAFAILCAGAAFGLGLYTAYKSSRKRITSTPAPFLGLMGLMILISIPLSTARASTMAGIILAIGVAAMFRQNLKQRLNRKKSRWSPNRFGMLAVIIIVVGFGALISKDAWLQEFRQTRLQLTNLESGGIGDARLTFYRDTLKLIREKPLFGWGWQSFQYVYPDVQSEIPRMHARTGRYAVLDAHNDWLQVIAETGIFGLACLLTGVCGCFRWGRWSLWQNSPSCGLLLSLLALALLAVVDFPLACPAVVVTASAILGIGSELARSSPDSLPAAKTNRTLRDV